MSSHICLFVFFLAIIVRFGENSENIDCTESAPGSDETSLTEAEQKLKDDINVIEYFDENLGVFSNNNTIFTNLSEYIHLILPGTLWCGAGNSTKNKTELGFFNNTDVCCKIHDNCKNNISSGKTKVNIKNNGLFTRSACYCDQKFYNCLKNASNPISEIIAKTYFNILQPQCFQCTCPTDNCQINNSNDCCTKYKWIDNL